MFPFFNWIFFGQWRRLSLENFAFERLSRRNRSGVRDISSYFFLSKLFKNSLNNTRPTGVQTYSTKYPKFAFSLMMFPLLPRQKDVDGR